MFLNYLRKQKPEAISANLLPPEEKLGVGMLPLCGLMLLCCRHLGHVRVALDCPKHKKILFS